MRRSSQNAERAPMARDERRGARRDRGANTVLRRLADGLLDGAEDRLAAWVEHLDANPVAEAQERRRRFAGEDRFHRSLLGDAGVAGAATRDRPPGTAVLLVGHGAGADDGSSGERARFRRVRNELAKAEGHVDAGIGSPEQRAVQVSDQRQMQLAVAPRVAELVRRHRDRRKARRRLALKEAEALA